MKTIPEPRADCDNCPMCAELPWGFDREIRCCGYHPPMPNLLAGRALRRGGAGAQRVRARLAEGEGVSAWGIRGPAAVMARYRANGSEGFGRDMATRCPFWVGGNRACGVWEDRPGVCQTWFCIHEHGRDGGRWWRALSDRLSEQEDQLAELLIERGDPDAFADIADWFLWCAERADALTDDELAPIRAATEEMPPMPARPEWPERPQPGVTAIHPLGDRVGLAGYSPFDVVVAPREVFDLLSRLDGATELDSAMADSGIEPALVDELVRIRAIEPGE